MQLIKIIYTHQADDDKIELYFDVQSDKDRSRFKLEDIKKRIANFLNVDEKKILKSENHDWVTENESK
jgi:hypothetical protein